MAQKPGTKVCPVPTHLPPLTACPIWHALCLFCWLVFETGLQISQKALILYRQLSIPLNSRSSCFHLPSAGVPVLHSLTGFIQHYRLNPGPCMCWAITLLTGPHPQTLHLPTLAHRVLVVLQTLVCCSFSCLECLLLS